MPAPKDPKKYEEWIKKVAITSKEKWQNKRYRKRTIKSMKGKKRTRETRKKMSKSSKEREKYLKSLAKKYWSKTTKKEHKKRKALFEKLFYSGLSDKEIAKRMSIQLGKHQRDYGSVLWYKFCLSRKMAQRYSSGSEGHTHTKDWKKRQSERFRGKRNPRYGIQSEFMKQRHKLYGHPFKGEKHKEESKKKTSLALKDRIITLEHREKIRQGELRAFKEGRRLRCT